MGNNQGSVSSETNKHTKHFPHINANVASVISRYLSPTDHYNLGRASKQMSHLFLHNDKIMYEQIELIQALLDRENMNKDFRSFAKANFKSLSHLFNETKYIYSVEKTEGDEKNGFKAISLSKSDGKPHFIFSSNPFDFAWKNDPNYWPMEKHKESIFEHAIPHLKAVCWFRIYAEFVLKKEKGYKVLLRMAGDDNLDIKDADFMIDYKDEILREHTPIIKTELSDQEHKRFKSLKGKMDYWELGSFKFPKCESETLTFCFRTQERSGWWKHGWWLDAIVFVPLDK